jgi:KDO2-lipid IV(A) lauroyltransferase
VLLTWFFRLLSRLPLPVLYVLSDASAWLARRMVRYRRAVILDNLRRSFPEKSPEEIRRIGRAFYTNLTDVMVETLKGLTISEAELRRRVTFRGLEQIEACHRQRQPIILLAAHQGNWEWLLLAGCLQLPHPVDAVYKPLANKKMDTLMYRARARFGGQPIAKDRVLREVLRRRDQVRATTLVADQTPARSTPKYWLSFLGQETGFYRGIEQLPRAVQQPVFFVALRRTRRGYYQATFVPVGSPPYEKEGTNILSAYAAQAEAVVREQPDSWLWSHQRWK